MDRIAVRELRLEFLLRDISERMHPASARSVILERRDWGDRP